MIRRATPADAPAIAAVHVRAWEAAYRGLLPDEVIDAMTLDVRLDAWRALLDPAQAGATTTTVAEAGDAVAGFATLALPARDSDATRATAELAALYVDPPRWRAGTGTALMDTALTSLDGDGWTDLTLWVLPENAPAIAFYERFGFAADGATNAEHHERTTIRLRRALGA